MITEDLLLRDAEFFADCGLCPSPEECGELEELYDEFGDTVQFHDGIEEDLIIFILLIKEFFYN